MVEERDHSAFRLSSSPMSYWEIAEGSELGEEDG